ncbi:unnamed protein product [Ilex paraguariensis]|uniref:Chlororespiratory reduction 21 n=1 Tax=Ilex paraguariensis TaxID=185542 RepID=A0ABC8UM54_9AQUA
MIQKTIKTCSITFLQKCKTLNQLKQIHAHLLKFQLLENPIAIGPVLNFGATSDNPSFFSYARSLFQSLQYRNTFMYNTMIRGYVQENSPLSAVLCYVEMLNYGLIANNYTFPPLIKACAIMLPNFKLTGRLVHGHIVELGFSNDPFVVSSLIEFYSLDDDIERARMLFDKIPEKDVVLWTAMIDGYGKMGLVESARALFDEMPERNVISWSSIMAAYSRISDFKEVLGLYRSMQEVGIKPNESVLVSVLTACAHLGALAQGLWVHSYARRYNLESNPRLATALVDMYSKCGCVELALSVFEDITNKDAGAWNAIISGVALNGITRKSLELFNEMASNGTQPSETTFVAVLTACTHAKLVREGLGFFEQMVTRYGIKPKFEHHACVVDLLARAGRLEEAEKFIDEKMGGIKEGDANVWGSLLGACRIYGNVEIGNRVWKKLAEMGLADCGTHVLSYNIYKEAGWETEAKNVRRLITEVGMQRKPGCSVIEVNGVVEEFLAGDLLHPKAQELSKLLDSLNIQLY